jgi:hypothetical protein
MQNAEPRFKVVDGPERGTLYILDTKHNRFIDPIPYHKRDVAEAACAEGNRQWEETGTIPSTWLLAFTINALNAPLGIAEL